MMTLMFKDLEDAGPASPAPSSEPGLLHACTCITDHGSPARRATAACWRSGPAGQLGNRDQAKALLLLSIVPGGMIPLAHGEW